MTELNVGRLADDLQTLVSDAVRIVGACVRGGRVGRRVVGYPSNAGSAIRCRPVPRAGRSVQLYRQPHIQRSAGHAGGHAAAARDRSTPCEWEAMTGRLEA